MNEQINGGCIRQTMQGFYKVAEVDAVTNQVKYESDWQKNLILNQGMEQVYTLTLSELSAYAIAGDGTRPNSISSGVSTITQSGAIVLLTPNPTGLQDFTSSVSTYAASAQVGDMLKYANNSESRITAVDSNGINLTVTPSYTIGTDQTFTIWKTSQVGLENEIKRGGGGITDAPYLTGAGNCGSTDVANVRTYRRTYDFVSESISKQYTEIGTSWSSGVTPTNVFSRILLPAPITIGATFKLRVIYDLQVTFTPATPQYIDAAIGGWPVAPATNTLATESIQKFLASTVDVNGSAGSGGGGLDPSISNMRFFASSTSTSLAAFGSAIDRSGDVETIGGTKAAYIPLSFYADKSVTFLEANINIDRIRAVGFGQYVQFTAVQPYAADYQAYCMLFTQNQTKANTQTLSFTWRNTWGRTLA